MTGQARLPVHLLVAMLIAGLSRPVHASLPAIQLRVLEAAATGPRIVVIGVGLDSKVRPQLGLLEHAAESAISRATRFRLLPVVDAYDPSASLAREAASQKASARIHDGQKALDDLDHPKALAAFVDALALIRQTNVAATFGDLVTAWVLKAASHAAGDENPQARQDIERIVAVFARAEFPSQHFPPELVEHAETQRRIASNAKGELTVRTEPSGAAVWVDGQYRGISPTLAKNIMGGRHVVTATLGGYSLSQEELAPGEGLVTLKAAELQPALLKAQDLIAKHPNGLVREQAAMELGKKVGADQVLLVIGKKSLAGEQIDLTAVRIDVSDGHNWAYQTAVVPMNDEDTTLSVLELVVASDTPRQQGNKPVFHVKGANAGPTGKQVAGIVLLATGAALVGGGVYSGLQAQSAQALYQGTPQVQTGIAESVATRGRNFSIVADASFVLAAASLVIGSVFLATGGRPASNQPAPEPEETPEPAAATRPDRKPTRESKPAPAPGKPVRETSDWSKPAAAKSPPPAETQQTSTPTPTPTPTTAPEPDSAADVERRAKDAREAEANRKETEARAAREEERRKKEDAKENGGSKKQRADEKAKEEEARKAKEAETKRADEAAKKKKEDEARKAKEAEAKRLEEEAKKKKKEEDDDDLRNY